MRNNIRLFFIMVFMLFVFSSCTETEQKAQQDIVDHTIHSLIPTDKMDVIFKEKIQPLLEKALIPGFSISVFNEDGVIWSRNYGELEKGSGRQVTENAVFQAASLTKPVFAYVVLQLVDEGVLDLDEPLVNLVGQEYIENEYLRAAMTDDRFKEITARMVLSHTSGLPNWRPRRKDTTLNFINDPGAKFGYSGEGFGMLQKTVEKLTNKKLPELMSEYVFSPLEMNNSYIIWNEELKNQTALSHNFPGKPGNYPSSGNYHAAASLFTNSVDYAKFVSALMRGDRLSDDMVKSLSTPQSVVNSERDGSSNWGPGIGLQLGKEPAFWHWGDNWNSKAFVVAYKESGVGLVYFANSFNGLAIVDKIVSTFIEGQHPVLTSELIDSYTRIDAPEFELLASVYTEGVDAAIKKFDSMVEENEGNKHIIPENSINNLGYMLLNENRYDDAIKVFILNTELYPESANVWDSLGEAYLASGDKESSRINYEKALSIDPQLQSAITALQNMH